MRLCLSFFALLVLVALPSFGATPASSPSQVDGITNLIVDRLWDQADEEWHQGDYPRIIALDRIIAEADPHFLEPYAVGGWLLESLGRLDEAEAFYQQGIRRNPKAAYAYYNLGFFYFNTRHDYRAAIKTFRRDVAQKDADLNDWKMLAHSYEHVGDWTQAVATWETIQARWPDGVNVNRLLQRARDRQKSQTTDGKPATP